MADTPAAEPKTYPGLEVMVGTEGNPDYAVVAVVENVRLGVKPVVTVLSTPLGIEGLYVGLRVRATAPDSQIPSAENVMAFFGKAQWLKAYPALKFENVDQVRASTMMGAKVALKPWQYAELVPLLEKEEVAEGFIAWLKERVPAGLAPEEDLLREWLIDRYAEIADKMAKHYSAGAAVASGAAYVGEIMEEVVKSVGEKMADMMGLSSQLLQPPPKAPKKDPIQKTASAKVLAFKPKQPNLESPPADLSHLQAMKAQGDFKKKDDGAEPDA